MLAKCRLEVQQNRPEQYFTEEDVQSGDIGAHYRRIQNREPSSLVMTFWLEEEDLPPLPAMNFMVGVKKDLTITIPRGNEIHVFKITGAWIKNAQYVGEEFSELGTLECEMVAYGATLLEIIEKDRYDPNPPRIEPPKEPELPDDLEPPCRILDI